MNPSLPIRRHFQVLALGLISLLLGGCLDEHPRDQLTEEQAFDNATNLYINAVATLYSYVGGSSDSQGLQGTARGVYDLQTFTSDEAMLPTRGGDWYDGGLWQTLYLHSWGGGGCSASNDTWFYLYKVIVHCNESLEHIDTYRHLLTAGQYQAYTAEVRALRAMYYLYLLDLYGRVPYIVSTEIDFSKAVQMQRSDLFRTLYAEFAETLPQLSASHSNTKGDHYGRMTQPVVCFLLAKMALNAEVWMDDNWTGSQRTDGNVLIMPDGMTAWEACVYWCDRVSSYGYALESNYSSNFAVTNENSVENIFVIPMDKFLYTQQFKNLFRSRHYNHGAALGMASENGTSATRSTVLAYGYGTDEVDKRYPLNFYSGTVTVDGKTVLLDDGEPLVYEPLKVELDLTGSPYEKTAGARMSKYEVDRNALSDGLLQNNDIVLFRYADVLLMKSEAKLRMGQDGSAEMNQVRWRVGMGDRTATLDNILDERLMELAWEGWRRQDLIRFDRFHQAYDQRPQMTGEADRHTIVFPIPERVIKLNPNNTQNPGY